MATAIMLQMHSRVTAVDVPEVCGSLASLAASSNYQLGEHMGWPAAKTSIETSTNWSLDQAPVVDGSHDISIYPYTHVSCEGARTSEPGPRQGECPAQIRPCLPPGPHTAHYTPNTTNHGTTTSRPSRVSSKSKRVR